MENKQSMVVVTLTVSKEDKSMCLAEYTLNRTSQLGNDQPWLQLQQEQAGVEVDGHAEVYGSRYQYLKRFSCQQAEYQNFTQLQAKSTDDGRMGPPWPYSTVKFSLR